MHDLKNMIAGDKQVTFQYYRKGYLYYQTECGFTFPVPIEDIGDATFKSQDRAMLFMRYIRKHLTAVQAEVSKF